MKLHSGKIMRQYNRLSKVRMQFITEVIKNEKPTLSTSLNTSTSHEESKPPSEPTQRNYTTFYHQPTYMHPYPYNYYTPPYYQYPHYYSTSAASSTSTTTTADVQQKNTSEEKLRQKLERIRLSEIRKEDNANFKHYLNTLPVLTYPDSYKVECVNNLDEANTKLNQLLQGEKSHQFGLDLEWQPCFVKGQPENKVSLVQICSEKHILLLQLSRMHGIPVELRRFFENKSYLKSGVNIVADGLKLYRDFGIVTNGLVELRDLVDISNSPQTHVSHLRSLRALTGLFLDQNMSKGSVRVSNWSRPTLTPLQIKYAALDAYASYKLFVVLDKLRDPTKTFTIRHLVDDDLSRVKKPGEKRKPNKQQPHQHNNQSSPTSTVTIIKKKKSITK